MEHFDELEKLIERRNAGEITAEEFAARKLELSKAVKIPAQTIEVNVNQKRNLGCFGIGCLGLILIFAIGAIGSNLSNKGNGQNSPNPGDSQLASVPDSNSTAAPQVSPEFQSALEKADSYANFMYMSKAALYDQLKSKYGEQFSAAASRYAVEHVVADWNANALEKAKSYQKDMNMSPAAIYDQLVSKYGEQFTKPQADYAIKHLND